MDYHIVYTYTAYQFNVDLVADSKKDLQDILSEQVL